MKPVTFNEELGHLVDEAGEKYDGKRFSGVTAWSSFSGFSSPEEAVRDALLKLEGEAKTLKAEAYEVTGNNIFDTKQEYDPRPYTAKVSAMLYKR